MRNSTLVWVSMALAVAFSVKAADVALADASADGTPPDASPPQAGPSAGGGGGPSAGGGSGATRGKILHSAPDDGGPQDFPASSRIVRDVVALRPNEDLIICIAGCLPGRDRVIYAQPLDRQALPKPAPVSEFEPKDAPKPEAAATQLAPLGTPATIEDKKGAQAVTGPDHQPIISDDKKIATPADPAAANEHPEETAAPAKASATKPAGDAKSEMVPTSGDHLGGIGAVFKAVRMGGTMPSGGAELKTPAKPAAEAK